MVSAGRVPTPPGPAKARTIKELNHASSTPRRFRTVANVDFTAAEPVTAPNSQYAAYKIIRRNGAVVGFEPPKISIAMTKAFLAVNGGTGAASARVREQVARMTEAVVQALVRRQPSGGTFHIEEIQDQVELALMRAGEHNVARAYVLYREERARERAKQRGSRARYARRGRRSTLPKMASRARSTRRRSRLWSRPRAKASAAT